MPFALLLDLDGTLIDTLEVILVTMNAALDEVGEPPLRTEELRPLIGMPVQRQMALLRGMEGAVVDEIAERYYRHFASHVEKGVRTYPGVRETLATLTGRSIGTISTRRREVGRLMLRVAGIEGCFTAVVGGNEVVRPKPHPDLVLHAARALARPLRECVVVGDASVDIQAARTAGAWAIAATYGYGDGPSLREAGPHAEIAEFSELPQTLEEIEANAGSLTPNKA